MKKQIAALFTACLLAVSSVPAYAAGEQDFYGIEWNGESTKASKTLTVTDNAVISEDFSLSRGKIRIEKDGVLRITKGAELLLNDSTLEIEAGGTLIISNGRVTLGKLTSSGKSESGRGSIINRGTLVIGKKGTLDIKAGSISALPQAELVMNGKLKCVTSTAFGNITSRIAKYDKSFSLSDYSVNISTTAKDPKSATFNFKYCIDSIETDYGYTALLKRGKSTKLTHPSVKLSEVYDSRLSGELLDRVSNYESTRELSDSFYDGISRSDYYTYSFGSGKLTSETWWFGYGEDIIYDSGDSVEVE